MPLRADYIAESGESFTRARAPSMLQGCKREDNFAKMDAATTGTCRRSWFCAKSVRRVYAACSPERTHRDQTSHSDSRAAFDGADRLASVGGLVSGHDRFPARWSGIQRDHLLRGPALVQGFHQR